MTIEQRNVTIEAICPQHGVIMRVFVGGNQWASRKCYFSTADDRRCGLPTKHSHVPSC